MVNKYLLPLFTHGQKIGRSLLNQLLPQRCFICEQATKNACAICPTCSILLSNQLLEKINSCLRCALPFTFSSKINNKAQLLCARCLLHPPQFERCIAATQYSPLSSKLINDLKHQQKLGCKNILTQLMIEAIEGRYQDTHSNQSQKLIVSKYIDLIIPVPLHNKRLAKRGFNQAAEIAKPIAKHFLIPITLNGCKRLINTPSQQHLNSASRVKNLHNSFWSDTKQVVGKRIAIVDDVVTTTHTANTIAKSLMQAGAISCEVWCFARTPTANHVP